MTYFLIRSWHVWAGWDSRGSQHRTLCGRWAAQGAEEAAALPSGRSCESCLRIARVNEERDVADEEVPT